MSTLVAANGWGHHGTGDYSPVVQLLGGWERQGLVPTAGHHSVHTGIQNHSLGELYPCIIVGFGDGMWGVQLGSEVIKTKTQAEAVAIAKEIKGELDRDYRLGVIRFTRMKVYGVCNE